MKEDEFNIGDKVYVIIYNYEITDGIIVDKKKTDIGFLYSVEYFYLYERLQKFYDVKIGKDEDDILLKRKELIEDSIEIHKSQIEHLEKLKKQFENDGEE